MACSYDPAIMLSDSPGTPTFDAFETLLDCLKRMEAGLIGMKQRRGYVTIKLGREMLKILIEEAETQIAEVKRKVIQ